MGKSSSSKSKSKTAVKGTLKKVQKGKTQKVLNKKHVSELGSMTLEEKVKHALEKADGNEEQASLLLKGQLSKLEHSKLWQKHKVHMKNHPEEK